jgi:flavin reductase (DIM6/NTAB) family NADH-FMN oxidoreductase RutF
MTLEFDLSEAEALKAVFRNHMSGVAVITTKLAGEPLGFTATSVTSLGATPPLINFNVSRGASFFAALQPGELVAIHTLTAKQEPLAIRMAGDRAERFASADWHWGENGLPIFHESSSVLIARIRQLISVESNAVVICDAEKAALGEAGSPLGYFQRSYVSPA